jgi:hypothetical protein
VFPALATIPVRFLNRSFFLPARYVDMVYLQTAEVRLGRRACYVFVTFCRVHARGANILNVYTSNVACLLSLILFWPNKNFCEGSGVDVMISIICDFCQFSAKKLAFFSKTNVMVRFLHNLALF